MMAGTHLEDMQPMNNAAVDRLEREVADLREELELVSRQRDELAAECERLEAALRRIADLAELPADDAS